jgi:AraC family ethanolamine operon transcriptional activator
MDGKVLAVKATLIHGPDDLREISRGSDVTIVQLKPGRLQGSIKHFGIGNLGISLGGFSSEIRVRGPLHPERVVLGTIFDTAGRVTQWGEEMRPGDIGIFPAREEVDAIHGGASGYLATSVDLPVLLSVVGGGEERLADPAFWMKKRVCNTNPIIGAEMMQRLRGIVAGIEQRATAPSDQAVDFVQRCIIECLLTGATSASPPTSGHSYTSARLVSKADDYIDAAAGRPIHISELSSALRVSRRSLHRAFADTLGIGPVAYLRCKRLSAIQSILRQSNPETTSIGEVAFEYGFPEPGRFASYYRSYFGETPSETLRSVTVS